MEHVDKRVRNRPQTDWCGSRPDIAMKVVAYPNKPGSDPDSHEHATHHEAAKRLAKLQACEFAGVFDKACNYDSPLYFVPSETLLVNEAADLGIGGEQDLFGGVVPYPFVATKTITHPLPGPHCRAPEGWLPDFAHRVRDVVLPGFSAFTLEDARAAGLRLLEFGAVRIKLASGVGGSGQSVATGIEELDAQLRSLDTKAVSESGVVLERNLAEVITHSVGQTCVGGIVASYYGTQRLTPDNQGQTVYGGSQLFVVRGDFDALLERCPQKNVYNAIAYARVYHAAAMASFPGMFASRCNYDVAEGADQQGKRLCGVLEQSWRIGGATGAEIAALEAFAADPAVKTVSASTTEIYGGSPAVPDDATIYFQGIDKNAGHVTKFSRLESYADT